MTELGTDYRQAVSRASHSWCRPARDSDVLICLLCTLFHNALVIVFSEYSVRLVQRI
ncbi:hypothetical protein BD309DRAFT_998268 [Dichomitus squalens]|nr:hypothetical protein BD309DRAFT_998268 [Dichomitus squalens]